MPVYHAVMIDETGCEFGASVPEVADRAAAYEWLAEYYPESRCDQLETPAEARAREDQYYEDARRGVYYEDGERFVEPGYEEYEDDEPEDEDDSEERFTDHADEPYHVEDSYLDSQWEES